MFKSSIPKHETLPASQTFPSKTSTESFWLSDRSRLDSYRSTPDIPPVSDIVIIGAGLSGIATAYEILERCTKYHANDPIPSITISEARSLCSGATGRNGGHLKIGVPRYHEVLKQHGKELASELAEFHLNQIYAMKEIVDKEGIDCDFLVTRTFDVFMNEEQAKEQEEMVQVLHEAGIEVVKREVQVIKEKDIEAVTGVKGARGARASVAAQVWAYKFCVGLTERILDRINLQTHTVVQSVGRNRNRDGLLEIVTARGHIEAKMVVFANNGYVAGTLPELEGIIIPWKGTCSYLSKNNMKSSNEQFRTFTYNVCKDSRRVDYINHRLDGNTIIGGGHQVFENDSELYVSVADDSSMIHESKMREYFANRLETYWQDWSEKGARIEKIWTGIMGYCPDNYPLIGKVPERDGQYILAGYTGAGMANITLCARGIAKMVVEDVPFREIQVPRNYEITKERLIGLRRVMHEALH